MEEIGIQVSKEVKNNKKFIKNLTLKFFCFKKVEENDSKSFIISSQYEQLENDDLYTKFKVTNASLKSIVYNSLLIIL